MKIVFILISLFSIHAVARVCNVEEIQRFDTRRVGVKYSPYPTMTRAALLGALLPLVPRFDSATSETNTFSIVNFAGLAGWVYFGLKSFESPSCLDDRKGDHLYQPGFKELLKFHHQEKELFWNTYMWTGLWMLGVVVTTSYPERQVAAVLAMGLPWGFSFFTNWSAFSEDRELEIAAFPTWDGQQISYKSAVKWTF